MLRGGDNKQIGSVLQCTMKWEMTNTESVGSFRSSLLELTMTIETYRKDNEGNKRHLTGEGGSMRCLEREGQLLVILGGDLISQHWVVS